MNLNDAETREDALARYALGDLRRDEAEELERLLATDPALAAEVKSLRRALDLMPYAAAAEPPQHLRARLMETAAHEAAGRSWTPALTRWPWSPMLAAAAVVLALVLGLDNHRLRRELALQQQVAQVLQEPNVVLSFSVKGSGTAARAFGNVVLDLDAKKGAVVIRGLPTLPEDRVYRLWAELGDKKVPCGEFNVDPTGAVVRQFPIPVSAYTSPIKRLILTLEPATARTAPVGPTVMSSS